MVSCVLFKEQVPPLWIHSKETAHQKHQQELNEQFINSLVLSNLHNQTESSLAVSKYLGHEDPIFAVNEIYHGYFTMSMFHSTDCLL